MAEALRCTQCGATLPTHTPEVASVACPSCDHVNSISGGLLEELHGHRREVADLRRSTRQDKGAAGQARVIRSFGHRWAVLFVGSWILAGFVGMPGTTLATVLAAAVMIGPFVAFVVVAMRRDREITEESRRLQELPVIVHCPGCGGQSELVPEEPVRPCSYCGGALAADAPDRAALLTVAEQSARRARRSAQHEGWRLAAHNNRDPRTEIVPYLMFGLIAGCWVIGTAAAAVISIFELRPDAAKPDDLAIMTGIGVVLVLAVGLPWWLRRRTLARWQAGVAALAVKGRGRASGDLDGFAEWLATHWTGDFASRWICAGVGYAFVAAEGPPWWAVSVAPVAQKQGRVEVHLRLLIPGDPRGSLL
ncbi:MAG: hypothetical protein KC431_31940, partial [Myxococcales bacterium]|nr:hypothetical protein [Myxococcales bacterium]